ncbi:hypothetical protein SNE40_004408 [Patella caerulea]|uniref:Acireductone dioxygenase n=1 Tax=Patella caerulea TaxID=87958 RepID=A0AAN8K5L5_PATCE
MVKIWLRDSDESNPSLPHQTSPPIFLSTDELFQRTGVKYIQVSDDACGDENQLKDLRLKHGYEHYDWLEIIPDTTEKHAKRMARFYEEHLHEDPEIRLITSGNGYFEIRDTEEKWIRIHMTRGDLIDLPPGIYHRFTLDTNGYIKMLRLFSEIPKWSAVNRCENDAHPARIRYEQFMKEAVTV